MGEGNVDPWALINVGVLSLVQGLAMLAKDDETIDKLYEIHDIVKRNVDYGESYSLWEILEKLSTIARDMNL